MTNLGMPEEDELNYCIVIGPVKSGTTLLISLLDSHPELMLFPMEVKFFTHWFEYLRHAQGSYRDLNSFFLSKSKVRLMDRDGGRHADIMNSGRIDFSNFNFDQFSEKMKVIENSNSVEALKVDALFRRYLYDIHSQMMLTLGRHETKTLVAKEGNHGARHLDEIRQLFPNLKTIIVVRDPRDIYVSLKTIARKVRGGITAPSFKDQITPCQFIYDNKGKNVSSFEKLFHWMNDKDYFHFVKYEELVSSSLDEMKRIAEFLDIKFSEQLTNPSNLGNKWRGNASSAEDLEVVTKKRTGKWQNELSDAEIRILEYFLEDYLRVGGYELSGRSLRKLRIAADIAATQLKAIPLRWEAPIRSIYRMCKNIVLLVSSIYCCFFCRDRLGL